VNVVAAAALVVATIAALGLVAPIARRTGLGALHPLIAWLGLEIVFFAIGSAWLAIADGRVGPALYVAAALVLFAAGAVASQALARRRASAGAIPAQPGQRAGPDSRFRGLRPAVVVGLAVAGLIALLPSLAAVGIPVLAGDITGARSEIGGLDLQPIRVFLPAAVLVALLAVVAGESGGSRRARGWAVGILVAAIAAELALASRYLAAELVAVVVVGLGLAGRRLAARPIIALVLVATAVFVGVGILRAYDQAAGRELDFAVARTVNRVLLIQPRTLDALQTAIPAEPPFLGGLTWVRRLAPALGRADVPNLGYWVYPRLFPDQVVPGYAAPGLLGETWANFGWLGLLPFAALGALAERLGAVVATRRRSVPDVVANSLLIVFLARTHAVGLDGLAVLVALSLAWRLLAAPPDGLGATLRSALAWRST
jgi:hypothetical protein